ncbi:MAG: type II secretion system secretin GspD [Deltaproteobacteria bacterium]|nr:type II secretion system secretin GspD [Deltaproteobacteria bacterium]
MIAIFLFLSALFVGDAFAQGKKQSPREREKRAASARRQEEQVKQARMLRRARRARKRARTAEKAGARRRPATGIKRGARAAGGPVASPGKEAEKAALEGLPGEKQFNECVKIPRRRRIKVTLKPDSDLKDLVAWISSMTCKKFILASNLRSQKVTLVSPVPITAGTAYSAFISALDVMGLTVVPTGHYLKIVQGNWAIQSNVPTFTYRQRRRLPRSDQIVTQIIQVKNVDVNELLLVFNKMKSRSGDVTAYRPANSLIITDGANRIRRMMRLLKELDVETPGEKIWVVRLRNADPEEVNKILQQIFGKKGGRRRPPARTARKVSKYKLSVTGSKAATDNSADAVASKIVTDTMTNSLIIVATAPAFQKIASLIRKLDVESEGVNESIHVHYLENADAEDMAQTLAGLTNGAASRGRTRGRTRTSTRSKTKRRKSSGPATLFEGDVKINADKATNSLVIVASTKDFLSLRRVIRRLDIPRRQVFIEAVIMEVSLDKSNKMGFAYHGGKLFGQGDSQSIGFGAVQHSNWQSMVIDPLSLMGLAAGARGALVDGSAELLGISADIPGFGVMFQAMQQDNNINVLSSPHILTTDNEQAEISVGQNLPFQGAFMGGGIGAAAGAAGMGSFLPSVSVQRQDVALKLKLTPHVNDSDMVRLELEQEVSDISSPNFNGLGPATSKRTAKTTIVVRDQQTVVIGGMMQERVTNTVSKVPLLGDIPILGFLFKYRTKSTVKTNLMIILTPYVIRDQSDLRRIFEKKLKERREFIERYTSFDPHDVGHDVDYRHKRGLLSEINRVGMQIEKEAALLKEARKTTSAAVEGVDMPKGMGSGGSGGASGTSRVRFDGKPPTHNPRLNPARSVRVRSGVRIK